MESDCKTRLIAPAHRPEGRRRDMVEVFEDGVVIADVVTDEKDINQEALDHLNEMGKGDEE